MNSSSAKTGQDIDQMVERARKGRLSRRKLVQGLVGLGASATAAATIGAAATWMKGRSQTSASSSSGQGQRNIQQHDQHLNRQSHATNSTPNAAPTPEALNHPALQARLDGILRDYHPDAVVQDMLSSGLIQGHEAIRLHKGLEMLTFSALNFAITSRYAVRDQVVAEWVASGVLDGEFKGLIGHGDAFEIPGVTVVTRDAEGKITKESIYYDLSHVQRYLTYRGDAV